ncbi:MAG TPA: class II fructose-bisphosphatase [Anaerolineae bacterium]|nr:class II fructose-bisphosphatase [Anaerolineae bacterium]HIP72521.1 class II fructose-bisphosphatase [Anaerolineae bacterium]
MSERPQRNLALELARATEAAALAAAQYMGMGDPAAGDAAAIEAMQLVLHSLDMEGVVVLGEGSKKETDKLYHGQLIGSGRPPAVDVAVDSVEGVKRLAAGRDGALAVAAITGRWQMWQPGPAKYLDKLVVGPAARDVIDITRPPAENLREIAAALGRSIHELTVFILDRPRNRPAVEAARQTGARVALHDDGDIAGALLAALPDTEIDVLLGIGGAVEGVLAAVALKALGAGMQCRRAPQSETEMQRVKAALDDEWDEPLMLDDLIHAADGFFAATGITGGPLLGGVNYDREGIVRTESIVMRIKTGTMRTIIARHQLERLQAISAVPYLQTDGR